MTVRVKVEFKNAPQVVATFKRLGKDGLDAIAKALYQVGNEIMTDSKNVYVPVRSGVLRSTGTVSLPRKLKDKVQVQLGYGGNAAPYAKVQHENLTYKHRAPQQAKYLETPALRRSQTIGPKIAHELKAALGRAAKR